MENKTVGVNKMIKAIFFDIDGTLVSFKTHQVPDSTIEALKQLKKKGIIDDSFGIHLIYTDKHVLMMISSETHFVNEVIKAIDKGVKQISITEEEVERMKKVLLSSQIYMSDNIYRMNNKIMRDMIDDYLTYTFGTKSYIENQINYKRFCVVLQQINSIISQIYPDYK